MHNMRHFSTAVAITDPLVKYQTLVRSGVYAPDPAQHRLARHLREIYLRIKDYSPQLEYRQRLNRVARLTEPNPPDDEAAHGILALRNHAIWRNPLFRHLLPAAAEGRESLGLIKVLSSHDMAIDMDSPKGLFLSGEVGTGKSMLLDLLANGLPTQRKRRWHFNTFMLYALSQLEKHRVAHARASALQSEYSLAWMAKKLVDESPILFLDEFQLPDRAASKILSHLFIAFFQLGGVLVASSNRMPEELQKAAGVIHAPGRSPGLVRRIFGGPSRSKGELYGQSSDFASFLNVLKARCDFWQMEGAKDWRRKEETDAAAVVSEHRATVGFAAAADGSSQDLNESQSCKKPYNYYLCGEEGHGWRQRIHETLAWTEAGPVPWKPSTLVVYGREVCVPQHYKGVVFWDFDKLVEAFGPADYITMASSFHTFIVDGIPVLTMAQKNEARRFITFLDALYETRGKLVVRAERPPDGLFFPATPDGSAAPAGPGDATYSETVAEVYQDQTSPFRPNVSYYNTQAPTSRYDPDQDSDFGPQRPSVDFGNTVAFTGEDERFAYKRAVSRLWELCSARWHARTGDWWQPLPTEARHWEGRRVAKPGGGAGAARHAQDSGEGVGESIAMDQVAGLSKCTVEHLERQSGGEQDPSGGSSTSRSQAAASRRAAGQGP